MLWEKEERNEKIPEPSSPGTISIKNKNDFISMVHADTDEYRKEMIKSVE